MERNSFICFASLFGFTFLNHKLNKDYYISTIYIIMHVTIYLFFLFMLFEHEEFNCSGTDSFGHSGAHNCIVERLDIDIFILFHENENTKVRGEYGNYMSDLWRLHPLRHVQQLHYRNYYELTWIFHGEKVKHLRYVRMNVWGVSNSAI